MNHPPCAPFGSIFSAQWPYAIITLAFVVQYLSYPALPGNDLNHPLGWWGWWDQGNYIKSARALASGNRNPDVHWYPLGFSLLAAPFIRLVPNHPFFFVNLAGLLASLWLTVRIAGIFGIKRHLAASLFLGSLLLDSAIFTQFVIPWNTTPVMVFVYGALYIALRAKPPGVLEVSISALCAALVAVTRPSDLVAMGPIGVALLMRLLAAHKPADVAKLLAAGAGAGFLVLAAYGVLHASIYGWKPSPYMVHASALGLSFAQFPAKLYAVLIDPVPVYGEGEGLIRRAPWLVWALPALGLAAVTHWRGSLIAAVVLLNLGFYSAFSDFLPHGIWRYHNIHYLKLSYPLLALMGVYGGMIAFRRRVVLWPLATTILLLLIVRIQPVEYPAAHVKVTGDRALSFQCEGCGNGRVAVIRPSTMTYKDIYLEPNEGRIGSFTFRNIYDFRTIPVASTLRAVFPKSFGDQVVTLTFAASHGYTVERLPQVTVVATRLSLRWPSWR